MPRRPFVLLAALVLALTHAPAQAATLKFCNQGSAAAYVALAEELPRRSDENPSVRVRGWRTIAPGACDSYRTGDVARGRFYWYAEFADGARNGGVYAMCVRGDGFDLYLDYRGGDLGGPVDCARHGARDAGFHKLGDRDWGSFIGIAN